MGYKERILLARRFSAGTGPGIIECSDGRLRERGMHSYFHFFFVISAFVGYSASALTPSRPNPFRFAQGRSRTILHYSVESSSSILSEKDQRSFLTDWAGIEDPGSRVCASIVPEALDPKEGSEDTTVLPHSITQLRSITCDAPAVLLKSGPGTGKTYALASRIAHLIGSKSCGPEQMVVLSFTNRDARNLKERAIDMMFGELSSLETSGLAKDQVNDRLWSGTIHAFASSLVKAYGISRRKLRIISNTESRMRVDKCLHFLLDEKNYQSDTEKLSKIRRFHRDALSELRQSRGMVMHQIGRCIELWKESSILPPPSVQGVLIEKVSEPRSKQMQLENCIKVAIRLGISSNVAQLAWEVYPEYQSMHEKHGTADPSDVASLAYHLLLSNPKKLTSIRGKLKHMIIDEYQDVSIAQHSLIRLIIRGIVDEDETYTVRPICEDSVVPPVLTGRKSGPLRDEQEFSFNVPKLFCCGDGNQSIYGWRGAAPSLTVDGFRKDYPQGIVVPLETSFRLSADMWNTVNLLADSDYFRSNTVVQAKSPMSQLHQNQLLRSSVDLPLVETLSMIIAADSSADDSATMRIQGVWDAREEAKFIVKKIRKRSKSRVTRVVNALRSATGHSSVVQTVADPSDIAIIVRSSNQMTMIKEALNSGGVPYVVYESESYGQRPSPVYPSGEIIQANQMKPVSLMSMHRAKGEEFDDVYLPGWSEGEFPHPTAVSSNRVDEERRLAYVSISRARSHVTITHSFVRRDLHYGPNLAQKLVTMQIRPSRFLYELVPDAQILANDVVTNSGYLKKNEVNQNVPSVIWNRQMGSKEWMAGHNLPSHFATSYSAPKHFELPKTTALNTTFLDCQRRQNSFAKSRAHQITVVEGSHTGENLLKVIYGLNQVFRGVRGAKTKYKTVFRSYLKDWFNFTGGSITTFSDEWTLEASNITKEVLAKVIAKRASKKAFSQCTTQQLGLYLVSKLFEE